MTSQVNVDQINPVNPLVPVNITGPNPPTFNGAPVALAFPLTPSGTTQTSVKITAGVGAPNNSEGSNGWVYFRSDGGAGTTVYHKRSGTWVGIL